jgi:hypothetical protein
MVTVAVGSENTRQRLEAAMAGFLADSSTQEKDIEALERFMSARPNFERPHSILPLDELEIRLDYIRTINDVATEWRRTQPAGLTRLEVSALLVMPLQSLREIRESVASFYEGVNVLDRIKDLVSLCEFSKYQSSSPVYLHVIETQHILSFIQLYLLTLISRKRQRTTAGRKGYQRIPQSLSLLDQHFSKAKAGVCHRT